MKPSGELFKLIRSLSKSEKRFFKLSSTLQAGEKNYLKLFDAIERQKEYNEDEIKDQFKSERFIKHLPSEKNHLYKLILKSLRAYHADSSVSSMLKEDIKSIEILYEKALYYECSKLIRKAKKLAYSHEKFYYLSELISWEKRLLEEEYLSGRFDKNLDDLIHEEQEVIEKLRNVAEYQILYSKINYVFRMRGYARNDQEKEIVEEISSHPLIKGKNTALSQRAAATCYYIQGLCAVTKHELETSFAKFSRVVDIFERNPSLIQDIPKQYLKSLNNLLYYYTDTRQFEAFFELIQKMRSLQDRPGFTSTDIKMKLFTTTYNSELLAYDRMGDYERGIAIVQEVMEGLERFSDKITKEEVILFYYNIAYIYFGAGEFRQSLHWLNRVLNDNEPNLRQDVYSFARLFNLIIHFELGNYDLLDYIVKSTSRFYLKRKREYDREYRFETVFLKYIKKLAKSADKKDKLRSTFVELKDEIDRVMQDNYERVALEYFDFSAWIESKIADVPFAEYKNQQLLELAK
ncbi:MAG: hypothetical protein ACFB10_02320 [Salibacteraceae bacterium]